MQLPRIVKKTEGRLAAHQNGLRVLHVLDFYGYLGRREVARAAWPDSPPDSAYVMASRTLTRLMKLGFVDHGKNVVAGTSFFLTASGARMLSEHSLRVIEDGNPRSGRSRGYDGPQFLHRMLGTCYLIDKKNEGHTVVSELALLKGYKGLSRDLFRKYYGKVPDGLVLRPDPEAEGNAWLVDWVEVENAYKPYAELRKCLELFQRPAGIPGAQSMSLGSLIFVVPGDETRRHEKAVMRAVNRFLDEGPRTFEGQHDLDPELVRKSVFIETCQVSIPFRYDGYSSTSAHRLHELSRYADQADRYDNIDDLDELADEAFAG